MLICPILCVSQNMHLAQQLKLDIRACFAVDNQRIYRYDVEFPRFQDYIVKYIVDVYVNLSFYCLFILEEGDVAGKEPGNCRNQSPFVSTSFSS